MAMSLLMHYYCAGFSIQDTLLFQCVMYTKGGNLYKTLELSKDSGYMHGNEIADCIIIMASFLVFNA